MAIEQGLGAGGTPEEPVVEDTTRMQEIPELPATPGITEFDDGSAVVGEYEEEGEPVADVPFDGNLADVIEEAMIVRDHQCATLVGLDELLQPANG